MNFIKSLKIIKVNVFYILMFIYYINRFVISFIIKIFNVKNVI